jgi:hypothetical protein
MFVRRRARYAAATQLPSCRPTRSIRSHQVVTARIGLFDDSLAQTHNATSII